MRHELHEGERAADEPTRQKSLEPGVCLLDSGSRKLDFDVVSLLEIDDRTCSDEAIKLIKRRIRKERTPQVPHHSSRKDQTLKEILNNILQPLPFLSKNPISSAPISYQVLNTEYERRKSR